METPSLESLDRRLRKLEDIEEIRSLRMRYHYFINEGHFDRFPEIFTEDGIVDFGHVGQANGAAEIGELFPKIPRSLDFVKQFIHNHMVDVDGDNATGVSYLEARYAKDGDSVMVAASFREKYRRTSNGWRIAETRLQLYFAVPITVGWAGRDLVYVKPFQ